MILETNVKLTCLCSFFQSKRPKIDLFYPPKSEVFRPAKALVANVEKKDYLGAAKVISTDSEEDCYACFSGIKDKVIEQKVGSPRYSFLLSKFTLALDHSRENFKMVVLILSKGQFKHMKIIYLATSSRLKKSNR